MKVITKSEAVYAYQCELCGTEFATEADALKCEESHIKSVRINDQVYQTCDSILPEIIEVEMKDGSMVQFRGPGLTPSTIKDGTTTSEGTTTLAIVDAFVVTVNKEYNADVLDEKGEATGEKELKVTPVVNASIELKDKELIVNIPDSEEVTTDMNICVKVTDGAGAEVTETTENSPFTKITILAEVKQVVENNCIEPTDEVEPTE